MADTAISCPFCGGHSNFPTFKSASSSDRERRWQRCSICGAEFPDPFPTTEELASAYSPDYYGALAQKFLWQIEWIISRFRNRRAKFIHSLRPDGGRILDIGCGNGDFLWRCKNFGFEVFGTELPGVAADRARARLNNSIFSGNLPAAQYPDQYFDLIVIWHVFEHLTEPRSYLAEIGRISKPGCLLVLAIPNIDSLQSRLFRGNWFHLDPPRHLVFMPPDRLEAALAAFGFKVQSLSHFSLEQNIFGWIQSVFNCFYSERDFFYEHLKGYSRSNPREMTAAIFQAILAVGLTPAAAILSLFESAAQRGGTFAGVYQKSGNSSQQL